MAPTGEKILRALWLRGARSALGRHVKDEHVKDAAQDMAHEMARDVVEGVSGAAEDGSVKVLILSIAISQWRRTGSSRPFPMGTRCWLASGACA